MRLISKYSGRYGLNKCLSFMGVAKSTYYYQLKRSEPLAKYSYLKKVLSRIIEENPGYGYRRLKAELSFCGYIVNHKLLLKLLRAWKLNLARAVKKKAVSGIEVVLSELGCLVNRAGEIKKPALFRVIFSDITEIVYEKGKVYLAAALDSKSKRLVGYNVSARPNTALVLSAYKKAVRYLKKRGIGLKEVVFHQDQGSVYTSYDYVGALVKDGVEISYSRKGTPSDNPEVESFFGRLKEEWADVFAQAKTEKEVIALINEKLSYYNGKRRHSSIDYLAPDAFVKRELAIA